MNNDNEYEIPEKATIRQEHVRCGNPDCQHLHGPYLYASGRMARNYRRNTYVKQLVIW